MKIPSLVLKQLYTYGSLENSPNGVVFGLKNRLSDAQVSSIKEIQFDKRKVPLDDLIFITGDEEFAPFRHQFREPDRVPFGQNSHGRLEKRVSRDR